MKKSHLISILSIAFFLAGGALASSDLLAQNDLDKIEKKLGEIGEELRQTVISGDYEAQLEFYTDDVILMPDFQPTIIGKAALRKRFEEGAKEGWKIDSIDGASEDLWVCGDLVYERGTFGMSVKPKEGGKPRAFYGSTFTIWQKQKDGAFKIKMAIWNLDFNPFGT